MKEMKRVLQHTELWPLWPFLPMKNPLYKGEHGFPKLGVMYDLTILGPPKRYCIHDCTLSTIPMKKADFEALNKWEYASLEALLDDGWLVD